MKKRLISLLLVLAMTLSLLPAAALAAETVTWAGAMNFNDANNQVTDTVSLTDSSYTQLKWAYPLNTTVMEGGAYYAGQVVIVGNDLYATGGGKLHKVNIQTGEGQTVGTAGSSGVNEVDYLCYGGGNLYVAIRESITAYCLDDLSKVWSVERGAGETDFGQYHPVQYLECGGNAYIWCNGSVFQAGNGTEVSVRFENEGTEWDRSAFAWSSGAVVGDHFYVTDTAAVYAIDMETWTVTDQWTYFDGTAGNTSGQVAYDSASGRLFWGCKAGKAQNLYSIKLGSGGKFAENSGKAVASGFNSVCAPVIHNGRVYLVGQGKSFIAVYTIDQETDEISQVYTMGSAYTTTTVQSNPILSADGEKVRLYFQSNKGTLYAMEDQGSSGSLTALAETPNYTDVLYPYAYEQIAMDGEGDLYCYNESGYLFCYGVSDCEVPTITADLSTEQVKYALIASEVTALAVEAAVTDGGTLSYQWQSSPDRMTWSVLAGKTEDRYTPPVDGEGTTYYRCIVTNTRGGSSASRESAIAEVLVKVLGREVTLSGIMVNESNSFTSAAKPLSPAFAAETTAYIANGVNTGNTSGQRARVWVKPTDENASVTITALYNVGKSTSENFAAGDALTVSAGTGNGAGYQRAMFYYGTEGEAGQKYAAVKVTVTAENGIEQKEYIIVAAQDSAAVLPVATKLSLDQTNITFTEAGQTKALAAVVTEQIGEGTPAVTWMSSNEEVATVDDNGVVACAAGGTAVITASCGAASASCTVTTEGVAAASVRVYVTIANAGSTVAGKDGSYVARSAVTVPDYNTDGQVTMDETLRAAHETYYDGGTAGYASEDTAYGRSITRLWGDVSGCYGYWRNNSSCWSLNDVVSANDHVKAFVYTDKTNWSDVYTAFTQDTAEVTAGKELTLTLNGYSWDNAAYGYTAAACEGAKLRVLNGSTQDTWVTDANGQATLSISKAGEYIVEAYAEDGSIVPAVCKVTVSAAGQSGGSTAPKEETITIRFSLKTHNETWIAAHNVELEEDATVADAFHEVMDDRDEFSYDADSNYVRSITKDGTTLGEFDNGPNSGWKYMVNGVAPGVGMADKVLEDGDVLVWYYVTDYTKDTGRDENSKSFVEQEANGSVTLTPEADTNGRGEAVAEVSSKEIAASIQQAEEENAAAIVIEPDVSGKVSKVTVELPNTAVEKLADTDELALTVSTSLGSVTVSHDGLKDLAEQSEADVAISLENLKDENEKETGEVRVEVSAGGVLVEKLSGGLEVSIPSSSDDPGNVLVLVGADGTYTILRKSTVGANGAHYAVIPGSATVKIISNGKDFTDVAADDTFADAVAFMTARELMNGISGDRFGGSAAATRAMVWTILGRGEGEALYGADVFEKAKAWAQSAGISDGSNPEGKITRQQLAAMLWRQAGSPESAYQLDAFNDAGKISSYAETAMRWCVEQGILSGRTNGDLDPQGLASRYHIAAMYMRYLKAV